MRERERMRECVCERESEFEVEAGVGRREESCGYSVRSISVLGRTTEHV